MRMKTDALFERRARRTRFKLRKVSGGRPRLSVFRSEQHIYAQVIDDAAGKTLASASTLELVKKGEMPKGTNKDAAAAVGKTVAARALEQGVTKVVFDRGGYQYHGRIKALADAARDAGLDF